ncbi:MAG: hypothetical protein RIE08_05500 [Acidimicrobiales bacterium]
MILIAFVAAACGSAAPTATDDTAFGLIRDRQDKLDVLDVDGTLVEILTEPQQPGRVIVEATVAEVANGVGMFWTFDDEENELRRIVAFDDEEAEVRSVHLTLRVNHVVAAAADVSVSAGDEVVAGLTVDTAAETQVFRRDLEDRSFVFFLQPSVVFDYEPDLYGIALAGSLICERGDTVELSCPGLQPDIATTMKIAEVTEAMLVAVPG